MKIKTRLFAVFICIFLLISTPQILLADDIGGGETDASTDIGETAADTEGEEVTSENSDTTSEPNSCETTGNPEDTADNAKSRNAKKKEAEKAQGGTADTGEADEKDGFPEGNHPTGQGLTEWSLRAVNEKWDYVWGGATPGAVDCSGLICAYMMEFGIYDTPRATLDMVYSAYNGGGMDTLPEIPGLILYTPGHVGVYIGNGLVVEAQMEEVGVIMSSLDYRWQAWFMLPGIDYGESEQAQMAREIVFEPAFTETETEETSDPAETTTAQITTAETETEKPFISTGDRARDINRKLAAQRAAQAVPTRSYRYLPYGICAAAIAVCLAVAAKKTVALKKSVKTPGNEEDR